MFLKHEKHRLRCFEKQEVLRHVDLKGNAPGLRLQEGQVVPLAKTP